MAARLGLCTAVLAHPPPTHCWATGKPRSPMRWTGPVCCVHMGHAGTPEGNAMQAHRPYQCRTRRGHSSMQPAPHLLSFKACSLPLPPGSLPRCLQLHWGTYWLPSLAAGQLCHRKFHFLSLAPNQHLSQTRCYINTSDRKNHPSVSVGILANETTTLRGSPPSYPGRTFP